MKYFRPKLSPKGERAREAFLDAGAELLDDRVASKLLPTARETTYRATGTNHSGSFANAFGDLEGFHVSLLYERFFTDAGWATIEATAQEIQKTNERFRSFAADAVPRELSAIAQFNFDGLLADREGLRRQFLFTALAIGPDGDWIRSFLKDEVYESFTSAYSEAYEGFLDQWGRTARAPFTARDIAVILTALTEGMLMRCVCDDSIAEGLYSDALCALICILTAPNEDTRTVDDVFTESLRYESDTRGTS